MTTASTTKTRRDTLNLRIPPAERNLIDRAAESAGKTRTDFILEAARRAGLRTLRDCALALVASGETTLEELLRVTRED